MPEKTSMKKSLIMLFIITNNYKKKTELLLVKISIFMNVYYINFGSFLKLQK
jgi:hypothetical protein